MSVNVGTAIGYLDLDVSKFMAGLDTVTSKSQAAMKNMEDRWKSTGDKLESTGAKMTATITAPIKAAEGLMIKTAAGFEAQMSKVSAISGATGEDLESLTDKAKEMGKQTKFSASESAQAFQYMAMAGWKTEDMLQGIEGIMNLAAADGLDLATTSDIVTDALTAFGLKAEDAGHFTDVLAQSSRNANTNVSMLGESFKYVAPVAGAMGYSIEDISLALGTMANSGIKGSQAGTALRSALSRLVNPTENITSALERYNVVQTEAVRLIDPKKLAAAQESYEKLTLKQYKAQVKYNNALEKYGQYASQTQIAEAELASVNKELSEAVEKLKFEQEGSNFTTRTTENLLTDEEGKMRSLREVLEKFRTSMRDLDKDEQAQAASIIFGQEAMSGMLAIINASDEDFNKFANAIDNSDGTAKEMADTMNDNLSGQLTLLKSQLEGIAIDVGNLLLPSVKNLVNKVSELATKFESLSTSQQLTIVKIASIVSAIGPMLLIMGKTIKTINTLIKIGKAVKGVITAINAALLANPIAIVIAAIAALVAAFVYFYKTNEDFRNKVNAAWEKIKETVIIVAGKIKEVWSNLCSFLLPVFEAVWNAIKSAISFIVPIFMSIVEDLKPLFEEMVGAFKEAWEVIKLVWEKVLPFFKEIWAGIKQTFSAVSDTLGEFFENAWEKIKDVWDSVEPYFKSLWEAIKKTFSVVATVLGGFFQMAWIAIKTTWDVAIKFFTLVWAGIKAVFSVVKGVLSGDFTDAWNAIKNVWNRAIDFFAAIWNGIKAIFALVDSWFGGMFSNAWQNIVDVWNGAIGFFVGIWNGISSAFSEVGSFFAKIFKDAWNNITEAFKDVTSFFSGLWNDISGVFWDIGTSVGETVGGAFKSVINSVLEYVESIINDAVDLINGAIDIINKIPGVDIGEIGSVELPRLAKGGIVTNPIVAQIGEQGKEAVVPLERNTQWLNKIAEKISKTITIDITPLAYMLEKIIVANRQAQSFESVPVMSAKKSKQLYGQDSEENNSDVPKQNGDTFIFNSPKAIDEKEAAKQIKKIKREIIEGF